MAGRIKTKFPGVYRRESRERQFKGGPDICFDIAYKLDGRKVWEKCGWLSEGYSEKLASQIRAERVRAIRHGLELPKQRKKAPYFRDAWAKYRQWAEKNKTRAGRDDISRYRLYLEGPLADKHLNEISSFDLERLKSDLLKKGLAPATVKHSLILIRQIYNKAAAWGLYQGPNPVKGVKLPSLQNQRGRFLSPEEADRLLTALADMRTADLHDMALLSLHTGLRAGEIFSLRGYDLDFENGILRVTDPKNRQTRHAYITEAVKNMLLRRSPATPEGLVFPDRNGHKIEAVSQYFRKTVEALGFNDGIADRRQKVSFHTLRHTFASWLALQGESIITLKEMLGHKSTVMTERYSHLLPNHKRRAAARLEATFNGHKDSIVEAKRNEGD